MGQLRMGGGSAGLIWKPEGRGRAREKTMGLCVGRRACVHGREEGGGRKGGKRRRGPAPRLEQEHMWGQDRSRQPGTQQNKGACGDRRARGRGGRRQGAFQARAPEVLSRTWAPRTLSIQPPDTRQRLAHLPRGSQRTTPRARAPSSGLPTPRTVQFPARAGDSGQLRAPRTRLEPKSRGTDEQGRETAGCGALPNDPDYPRYPRPPGAGRGTQQRAPASLKIGASQFSPYRSSTNGPR